MGTKRVTKQKYNKQALEQTNKFLCKQLAICFAKSKQESVRIIYVCHSVAKFGASSWAPQVCQTVGGVKNVSRKRNESESKPLFEYKRRETQSSEKKACTEKRWQKKQLGGIANEAIENECAGERRRGKSYIASCS